MNINSRNKKLLVFFGIVLVVFLMFFVFNKYKNKEFVYNSLTTNQGTQEIAQKITIKDSDNDGLKDWEEILWGTDLNNPDSDGDGMNDNDEILAGRDPLVEGVGDFNKIIIEGRKISKTSQSTLTQTDILAREVFSGYIALKQNDVLGTQEQAKFIEKITANSLGIEPNIKYLTLNDLKISQDSSKESLQKYSIELKQVFSNIPELRDDNLILKEALDSNSPEKLEEIKSNMVFYEKAIGDLIKIEIPSILQNKHLNLINSFKKITGNIEQMVQVFQDPILALVGAKEYYNTLQEIALASAEIGEFFKKNNIIF